MKKYTSEQVKDLTGFELYIKSQGYEMLPANNYYFNTYDCCSRLWENSKRQCISIGLMDTPTRVGIRYPVININRSYLPSEEQYKECLETIEKELI